MLPDWQESQLTDLLHENYGQKSQQGCTNSIDVPKKGVLRLPCNQYTKVNESNPLQAPHCELPTPRWLL